MAVALPPSQKPCVSDTSTISLPKSSESSIFGYRCIYPFHLEGEIQSHSGGSRRKRKTRTSRQSHDENYVTLLNRKLGAINPKFEAFLKEKKGISTTSDLYTEATKEFSPQAIKVINLHDDLCRETLALIQEFSPASLAAQQTRPDCQPKCTKAYLENISILAFNIVRVCSLQSLATVNMATAVESCVLDVMHRAEAKSAQRLDDMKELCCRASALSEAALRYHPYAAKEYIEEACKKTGASPLTKTSQIEINQQALGILLQTAIRLYHFSHPNIPKEVVISSEQKSLISKIDIIYNQYLEQLAHVCAPALDYVDPSPDQLMLQACCCILLNDINGFEKAIRAIKVSEDHSFRPACRELAERKHISCLPGGDKAYMAFDLQLIKLMPCILETAFHQHRGNHLKQVEIVDRFEAIFQQFQSYWEQLATDLKDLPDGRHRMYDSSLNLLKPSLGRYRVALKSCKVSSECHALDLLCSDLESKLSCTSWDIDTSIKRVNHFAAKKTPINSKSKRVGGGHLVTSATEESVTDQRTELSPLAAILETIKQDPDKRKSNAIKRLEKIFNDESQPELLRAWAALYLGNIAVIPCTQALVDCLRAQKHILEYGDSLDQCEPGELPPAELNRALLEHSGKLSDACFRISVALDLASNYYDETSRMVANSYNLRMETSFMAEVNAVFQADHPELTQAATFQQRVPDIFFKRREAIAKAKARIPQSRDKGAQDKRKQTVEKLLQKSNLFSESLQRFEKVRAQYSLLEEFPALASSS